MPTRAASVAVLLALLLLPLLFLWRPLFQGETFHSDDLAAQYFPREELLRRAGATAWNGHEFLGMGLAADPQSAPLEPVRALARAVGLSDRLGFCAYVWFYLAVATTGVWLYARRLGAGGAGAALAVLAAVWGGTYLVRFRHPWMFASMAMTPWIAWGADRLIAARRLSAAIPIGVAIAWGALGGHPQPPYMQGLFATAYVAIGTWAAVPPGARRSALVAQGLRLAGAAALAAGLLAAVYVPVAAELVGSARGAGGGLRFAASFPFNPWDWPRLLAPDFYGIDLTGSHFGTRNYHEQTCYLGVAPLVLFGLGLAWRRPLERRLGALAIAFFALAAGPFLPPFFLAYAAIPGFRLFRAACRYGWFFSLLASVIAGLTLARIAAGARPPEAPRVRRRLGIVLLVAAGIFAVWAIGVASWPAIDRITRPGAHRDSAWAAARAALWLCGARLLLDAWLRRRLAPRWTVRGLLALTCLDLALQWLPYRQTQPPARAFPDPAVVDALAAASPDRVFVYTAGHPGRPDTVPLLDWGEAAGYENLRGYNQAAPREVIELLASSDVSGRPRRSPDALADVEPADWLLDLAGVSRLAARSDEWPARWRELPLEAEGGGWQVRRRAGAFPRAWLVGAVERVPGAAAALARLPAIDPRRWAIVDAEAAPRVSNVLELDEPPAGGEAGVAAVVARGPAEVIVDVRATRAALAVVAERIATGWSVDVDGEPRPLLRADGLFRGVEVAAGTHQLRFHYRAPGVVEGRVISLAVVVALAAYVLVLAIARARRRT